MTSPPIAQCRRSIVSVGGLMALVGLAGLNLAAARGLAAYDLAPWDLAIYDVNLMLGVMPTALVLQVALFRLVRSRGARRTFWAGFVAGGSLMLLSFVWANKSAGEIAFSGPVSILAGTHAISGGTRFVVVPGSWGADEMWAMWNDYSVFVERCLPAIPQHELVAAVVFLIPQMLAGLGCGVLSWLTWRGVERNRSDANMESS